MVDIFAQQGIDFQSSSIASTAPSDHAPSPRAPHVRLAPQDANPLSSTATGHGNPNMSPADQAGAMDYLYGDGAEAGGSPAPSAPVAPPPPAQVKGRDLFAEQGIEPPTVTQANANAFMDGVPLNTEPKKSETPDESAAGNASFAPISRASMSQPDFGDQQMQQQKVQQYAESDDAMIMKLASMRFTPSQMDQWKNNPITFTEAFGKLSAKQVIPGGGIASLYDSADLVRVAEKAKAGETLTTDDQGKLNAFLDEQIEQRVRGFSWGGNVAYIGSQIPAFAIEFALSDGVGKAAQTALKKTAEEAGIHAAISSSVAAASRVATTTALMPGQYVPKYGERRINDVMAVTDKGELMLKESTESPAMSALLAYGHTSADAAAQIAAPGIGRYIVNPVQKLVSTPLVAAVNQLPAVTKDALYQAYKVIQPNAKVSKVFSAAGWAGMLEQLGSNRVADILHASLDLSSDDKMTMDQYLDRLTPSKDQLLVEAGLIGIAGGIHTSASVTYNLIKSKGVPAYHAQEAVDNMSAVEKDNYVNENLPMPKSAYPETPVAEADQMLDERQLHRLDPEVIDSALAEQKMSDKQKLVEALGEDGAAEYTRLQRAANGIIPDKADAAYARLSNIEDGFDARQRRLVFGEGDGNVSADSLATIAKAHADVRFDANDTDSHIGYIGTLGIRHIDPTEIIDVASNGGSAQAQAAFIRFGAAFSQLRARGLSGEEVANTMINSMVEHAGMSRNDAAHFLGEFTKAAKYQHNAELLAIGTDHTPAEIMADMPDSVATPDTVHYDGDAVKNQVAAAETKEPPPINNEESIFNWLNRALFNRGAAAEEPYNRAVKAGFTPAIMDRTPLMLSLNHQTPELARSHMMVNTFRWDDQGRIINTGKSLKAIMDDFDNYFLVQEPNRETRRNDFENFLIARHYLSMQETAPHIIVTPEQLAKSKADLDKIAAKYGENSRMFETLGNEFVEYRNRTRDLLVGNLLTKEQRANERKLFPYSVPLKREVEPAEYEGYIARGDYSSLNPGNLTKRLKGSALPVKNILHSTMRETARTIDFVMRNRVNESIYNLREYAPDKVQETSLPIVKQGSAEFTISHDPKLRDKLEKTIEFLGGTIARGEPKDIGLKRGTLGSYSPSESLVRMRIGTTEGTLAHEVGHMLDHKLNLKERLLKDPEIKKELKALAEDRLSGEHELVDTLEGIRFRDEKAKASKQYESYIKNDDEILANMFDAYVNSPEQLEAVAPKAKAAFEKLIDDNKQLAFLRDIKPSTSRQTEKVKKDVYGYGDLPANTFAFWNNGEKKFVKVSKQMFESLSSMRPSQISSAAKFFSTTFRILSAARGLTFGATNTPEFVLRNPVRDMQEAAVQSGVGYNATYLPKTLYRMLTKAPEYQEFVQAGGKFASFMALDDANIEKTFADILNPKSKFRQLVAHPLEAYEKIPKASETLTRFGVYRAALDKGYSPVEAAQFALDATLNFPRGGFAVKTANQYMPFLNVGFLATERLVRAIHADPKTVTIRGITFLTAPSLMIAGYYLYGADEETRKEWLELPINHIAEGRVYFKYNGEWRYIPTPYAIGYLFSGLPQIALRSLHKNNPDDGRAVWEHLMKGFVGAVSPVQDWSSLLPPTIKTAIEDITNYDFYRGRSIYSKFKEGDNVLQKDKTNAFDSETAKGLGNIFNVSPAIIDHSIYGLFGGSGGYALKASDAAISGVRRARGETVPEKPRTGADIPGVAAFTSRAPEGTRSNSYQGWQQHYQDVQAIAGHLKGMEAGPDKADYQRDNARTIAQLSQLKSAAKVIENRLKQIRAITADEHMSSEQKTERIGTLEKEITRVARNSNNQYNAAHQADK